MKNPLLQTGIDRLLSDPPALLENQRIGLIAHPASVDAQGTHTAHRLFEDQRFQLTALFGPEHGFFGYAGPGEKVTSEQHNELNRPIHSLYGATRKPTAEMLKEVDVLIFDLQDLAIRCYTYGSTLLLALQAAAEHNIPVVVTDRPVPFCQTVDGPCRVDSIDSFVALLPTPLVYGMTPGETAQFLVNELKLPVDLHVIPLLGDRSEQLKKLSNHWIPPSPGIRTLQTALTYPALVMCEALPALDYGRGHDFIFQVIGAPELDADQWHAKLVERSLPGIEFTIKHWHAKSDALKDRAVSGLQLHVSDPARYRPVETAIHLAETLQQFMPSKVLWQTPGTREHFFDKLLGTPSVRQQLQQDTPAPIIIAAWQTELQSFAHKRALALGSREQHPMHS